MLIGRPWAQPAIDPKALATVTRTRLAGTYLRIVVDVRPIL
jgi:hypothetical protein